MATLQIDQLASLKRNIKVVVSWVLLDMVAAVAGIGVSNLVAVQFKVHLTAQTTILTRRLLLL